MLIATWDKQEFVQEHQFLRLAHTHTCRLSVPRQRLLQGDWVSVCTVRFPWKSDVNFARSLPLQGRDAHLHCLAQSLSLPVHFTLPLHSPFAAMSSVRTSSATPTRRASLHCSSPTRPPSPRASLPGAAAVLLQLHIWSGRFGIERPTRGIIPQTCACV